jgi:hypothetical protein
MPGIKIVGFLCDENGRRPAPEKIQKIVDWPVPCSLRDARGFIGVVVYYRIFIRGFSIIAAPIFGLFRKGKLFLWSYECDLVMRELKWAITKAPVRIPLDFSCSMLMIYLFVDACTTIGWGTWLGQLQKSGAVLSVQFESGI